MFIKIIADNSSQLVQGVQRAKTRHSLTFVQSATLKDDHVGYGTLLRKGFVQGLIIYFQSQISARLLELGLNLEIKSGEVTNSVFRNHTI